MTRAKANALKKRAKAIVKKFENRRQSALQERFMAGTKKQTKGGSEERYHVIFEIYSGQEYGHEIEETMEISGFAPVRMDLIVRGRIADEQQVVSFHHAVSSKPF